MKKLFILPIIIFAFICCVAPATAARADANYLRVITEDTPFYENAGDAAPLFFLPYTYYVRVLGENDGFIHAEIYGTGKTAALDGYVPAEMLFSDGLEVKNPYPSATLTTASDAVLYSRPDTASAVQYLFPERELSYYGNMYSEAGERLYFVSYNNRLGYVKEDDVYPFSLPNHPNELTFIKPEPSENPEQDLPEETGDLTSLKIIIIACLLVAGIIALVVALKTRPRRSAAVYYDENDYE